VCRGPPTPKKEHEEKYSNGPLRLVALATQTTLILLRAVYLEGVAEG
jgi:hypothetical protein